MKINMEVYIQYGVGSVGSENWSAEAITFGSDTAYLLLHTTWLKSLVCVFKA